MHAYSIETDERLKINLCIVVISALLSVAIQWLAFKTKLNLPWSISSYVSLPAFGGIYWSLFHIFDNYLWNKKIFGKLGIASIPDLNGKWEGNYESTYVKDGKYATGDVYLTIDQTWTKISIKSENGSSSESYSEMAHIDINSAEGIVLKFQYGNKPNPSPKTPQGMIPHIGFSKLCYNLEKDTLSGEYFSDKNRRTQGSVNYKKKQP